MCDNICSLFQLDRTIQNLCRCTKLLKHQAIWAMHEFLEEFSKLTSWNLPNDEKMKQKWKYYTYEPFINWASSIYIARNRYIKQVKLYIHTYNTQYIFTINVFCFLICVQFISFLNLFSNYSLFICCARCSTRIESIHFYKN